MWVIDIDIHLLHSKTTDNANLNASNVPNVGGNYSNTSNAGTFYRNTNTVSNANANIGARQCFLLFGSFSSRFNIDHPGTCQNIKESQTVLVGHTNRLRLIRKLHLRIHK
jgi:hypothetical protein